MWSSLERRLAAFVFGATLLPLSACGGRATEDVGSVVGVADELVIAAYSAPREAFERALIPAFEAEWKRTTGRSAKVRASYLGSGAQSRAVIQGFEADVAVLALESDVDKIARAGLIPNDWRTRTGANGTVARSLVVLAVRSGNPRGLHDWDDLGAADLEVLTPNPRTSGGAMWNLIAMYGSAALGPGGSAEAGVDRVRRVFRNVSVMDKGARESLVNFERGIGDVAITYEQEVHVARKAGRNYDYVIPPRTVAIDIPAAVIDGYARPRGHQALAEAFVAFLRRADAQPLWADWGFRPVGEAFAQPSHAAFPRLKADQTFAVAALGGWKSVMPSLFATRGSLTMAIEDVQATR